MYLLDTNIVSDLVRNPSGAVARQIARVGVDAVAASIVVACELRYGATRRKSAKLTEQLEQILELLPVLPLDQDVDEHYGVVRADLESRGMTIGANDLLIAAHALSISATLVTDNVKEFERVRNLKIENWVRV